VGAYRGLVEGLARKVASTRRARNVGAEFDDLVQEGLIAVWQALEAGLRISPDVVEGRMKNWVRYLGAGQGRDYEELLPLEDHTQRGG
jgi:hypothetical protein